MSLSDIQLGEIKHRVNAATRGPWVARHRHSCCTPDNDESCGLGLEIEGPPEASNRGQFERGADAQFIAHAREDIPALITEVEQLRAKLKAAEAKAERLTWETTSLGYKLCRFCALSQGLSERERDAALERIERLEPIVNAAVTYYVRRQECDEKYPLPPEPGTAEMAEYSYSLGQEQEALREMLSFIDDKLSEGVTAMKTELSARAALSAPATAHSQVKPDWPLCPACGEHIIDEPAWHSRCADTIVEECDAATKRVEAMDWRIACMDLAGRIEAFDLWGIAGHLPKLERKAWAESVQAAKDALAALEKGE